MSLKREVQDTALKPLLILPSLDSQKLPTDLAPLSRSRTFIREYSTPHRKLLKINLSFSRNATEGSVALPVGQGRFANYFGALERKIRLTRPPTPTLI